MGHMSSSNVIFANDDFYRFNIDKIIRADDASSTSNSTAATSSHLPDKGEDSQASKRLRLGMDLAKEKRFKRRKAMLQKHYFTMNIEMAPSGEKIYKINFEQPKVLARVDIFLMIGDFFQSGFPQYTADMLDKPNGWTDDPSNVRRREVLIEMRQALFCFENEEGAKTTVVCAGNMILDSTKENAKQIKLKLLDRMDKTTQLFSMNHAHLAH